jgi:hypothetical protein
MKHRRSLYALPVIVCGEQCAIGPDGRRCGALNPLYSDTRETATLTTDVPLVIGGVEVRGVEVRGFAPLASSVRERIG